MIGLFEIQFNNPRVLWLAILILPYLWLARRRVTTAAVRYPSVRHLKRLPKSFRQRCRALLPLMRAAALLILVVVLARPTRQLASQELPSEGIAIAMLLDRSASMGDTSTESKLMYEGELAVRFKVAQDLFNRFVVGGSKNRQLAGRQNDLIGLFTFATYPRTDYPFGLDHTALANAVKAMAPEKPFLDNLGRPTDDVRQAAAVRDQYGRQMPRINPLQMTDIKKAVEYAADKLTVLADDLSRGTAGLQKYDLKSKVMVLLTDGEPTVAGSGQGTEYPDEETARKLTDAGIRLYFIQILPDRIYRERPDGTVEVVLPRQVGFFNQIDASERARAANRTIEEARKLARRTGGRHFLATTGDQLKEVYAEINAMERSDVGARTYFSREELFGPWLLAALGLLAAETLLGLTYLRRSP